jgi:hypothetical protein
MWRNCKLCIAVIFGFFVFGQISVFAQTTNDSYCESVSICGSAPKEFTMMTEFTQEMLNAIKTMGTEWSYLGKYVNPNRFVGDKFSPPDQWIIGKAATNLWQKLDFVLATTAIFTSPQQWWGLKDLFAGILTLFKNSVFARDLQRVEKLDAAVTQTRYELGLGWWWGKTIRAENRVKFKAILDAYITKWLLDKNSTISDGVTYNNITAMAGRIDSALKSFLSLNTTDQFTSFTRWGSDGINLIFVQTTIQSMDDQYACARWTKNICATSYKQFVKNMKTIGSGMVDKIKKDNKIFADAGKRLTQIFSKDSSYLEREKELLNAYYGNQKVKTGSRFSSNAGEVLAKWRSALIDDQTKNTSAIDQIKNDATSSSSSAVDQVVSSQPFDTWMLAGMSPLLDQQQSDLALVNFSEVKDFSSYFDQLGKKLLGIKNILWTKDSSMLIQTLWQACELQCGWTTKKCW